MLPILIGQAPSRSTDGLPPFSGRSGRRLADLAGTPDLSWCERVNLIDRWPGSAGHGDRFPAREARSRALELIPLLGGRRVVLVGAAVARAFGARVGELAWGHDPVLRAELALLPHPSGVNLWWNLPTNVERARAFLRKLSGGWT